MSNAATIIDTLSGRLRGATGGTVPLDRLARLACAVSGARAAVVVADEGGRRVVVGRHGWSGPAPGRARAHRARAEELRPVATIPLRFPPGGEALGELVVMDAHARRWSPAERAALEDVAAAAAEELHRRPTPAPASERRGSALERERAARAHAEAGERRYAFLAEVSSLLDASLDYETSFQKLARLVVPSLADYCLIDEAEPGGGLRRIAKAHVDPAKEAILYTNTYHPPVSAEEDLSRHPVLRVIRTGLPLLVTDVGEEMVQRIAHDDDHRARLRVLDLRSYIIAPLAARGRVLGAITLAAAVESGRRYRAPDVAMAEEVARRAALAIDNARLYTLAQQAIRARDGVLEVVSHDLRNPLASILLNASMLLEMEAGEPRPAAEEHLRQIVCAVEQTNRLITDLLDISRLEASGALALERLPVDGRTLVNAAARLLQPLATARGVRLIAEAGGPPLPVYADADRVVQVLSNLIGNAVKFTDPGGEVRVSAERGAHEQCFAVSDTGIGIPAEHQAHVFDRFRQVGRDRRGVGLGLPIARGLVEAHGGKIWVESQTGAGTTVYFTLPVPDAHG